MKIYKLVSIVFLLIVFIVISGCSERSSGSKGQSSPADTLTNIAVTSTPATESTSSLAIETTQSTETSSIVSDSNTLPSSSLDTIASSGSHASVQDSTNPSHSHYPITVKDNKGREIVFTTKPERIVALGGTSLSVLADLKASIVGVVNLSDDAPKPENYENLAKLGKMNGIDVEKLISLQPDFVVLQQQAEKIIPILEENNIQYYFFKSSTFVDIKQEYQTFAQILDEQSLASELISNLDKRVDNILKINQTKEKVKKVAIINVAASSLSLKLENSIAGDVLGILGVNNIAAGLLPKEIGMDSAPFDLEKLVLEDPDVILLTSMLKEGTDPYEVLKGHLGEGTAWEMLSAVQNKKVFLLPQKYFLFNPMLKFDEAIELVSGFVFE